MYHFIVNKTASSGQGMITWNEIRGILDLRHISYELHTPDSRTDSIELIRSLSSATNPSPEHIVVIGGDGTLNTVIQGIDDFNSITLSLIPSGSGNDFANALKISKKAPKALLSILDSPTEDVIDYGEVTFKDETGNSKLHRFLISCGSGYDADICEEVNRSSTKSFLNKLHLGQIVYLYIAIKKIFTFKNYIKQHECDTELILDDTKKVHLNNMFLSVAMNTPFQGGGTPFCPMADWKDGYLDVCAVDSMNTPKLFLCIMAIYLKKHFLFKQVNHHRCRKMELQLKKARWLHTDGETHCETTSVITECKQGLHFIH